jgi:hypothetical protein
MTCPGGTRGQKTPFREQCSAQRSFATMHDRLDTLDTTESASSNYQKSTSLTTIPVWRSAFSRSRLDLLFWMKVETTIYNVKAAPHHITWKCFEQSICVSHQPEFLPEVCVGVAWICKWELKRIFTSHIHKEKLLPRNLPSRPPSPLGSISSLKSDAENDPE